MSGRRREQAMALPAGGLLRLRWSGDHVGFRVEMPDGTEFRCRRFDARQDGADHHEFDCTEILPDGDGQAIHAWDMVRKLDARGAAGAPALHALSCLLPPGTATLYARTPQPVMVYGSPGRGDLYQGDPVAAPARAALALRHPGLALVLHEVLAALPQAPRDALPEAGDLLRAYAPHARPGAVDRVLRTDWAIPAGYVLDALLAIPPDWFPETRPERTAFRLVAMAARSPAGAIGLDACLSASKGRWAEYLATLLDRNGTPRDGGTGNALADRALDEMALMAAMSGIRDMLRAFSEQAFAPALRAAGHLDDARFAAMATLPSHMRGWVFPHLTDIQALAGRVLFGDRSLPSIVEESRRWHARSAAIAATVAEAGRAHPSPGNPYPLGRWPVPFPPVTAPNGVSLRFLGDVASLGAEGMSGPDPEGVDGLEHCVGGYGATCARGASAIMSLRLAGPGGTRRLSTAEIHLDGGEARVAQHAAFRNGRPSAEAAEALGWFLAEVGKGRLKPSPEYLAPGWRRDDGPATVADACGYDPEAPEAVAAALAAWSPFLTRPLREPGALARAGALALAAMDPPAPRAVPRPRRAWVPRVAGSLADGIDRIVDRLEAIPLPGKRGIPEGGAAVTAGILSLAPLVPLLAGTPPVAVAVLAAATTIPLMGTMLAYPLLTAVSGWDGMPDALRRIHGSIRNRRQGLGIVETLRRTQGIRLLPS